MADGRRQTERSTRMVVLVNGLPAAGKSTLAPHLAAALGLPLFTMDVIKEAHADVLGVDPPYGLTQREWNRRLGLAASETMWALLKQSTPGAVLENLLAVNPFLAEFAGVIDPHGYRFCTCP